MDEFEVTQTLRTHRRFTLFEAYAKKLGFLVVLKQCVYTDDAEVEYFVRSALIKTRESAYSQPLLSIFPDFEAETKRSFIVFVWKRGNALDAEVETDQKSRFPPGKSGLSKLKTVYKSPGSAVSAKRMMCLTLGKEVICKVSKYADVADMGAVFSDALVLARCAHLNICDFLDFRMFLRKSNCHCAYIVMEWLDQDLASEVEKRNSLHQPYDEAELTKILQEVTAGLLHAKFQNLVHQDIKPHNILRGPNGLKVAGFGATWLKGVYSMTSTAGTDCYISPEAWKAKADAESLQRPFASDIFSLGMTMLHLAAMKPPPRTPAMSDCELQVLLQQTVQAMPYSEKFKRLLADVLRTAPSERPPLEFVQEEAARIYRLSTKGLWKEAHRLEELALAKVAKGEYAQVIELSSSAHALYSQLPAEQHTAHNLFRWGVALCKAKRTEEAVNKHAAADAIYSRLFPYRKSTAMNLGNWAAILYTMERYEEALAKCAAADAVYSRIFPSDKNTAINLSTWAAVLRKIGKNEEALTKYAAVDSIYSRLFPYDESAANNLLNWGTALITLRIRVEGARKLSEARAVYVLCENSRQALYCDRLIVQSP